MRLKRDQGLKNLFRMKGATLFTVAGAIVRFQYPK